MRTPTSIAPAAEQESKRIADASLAGIVGPVILPFVVSRLAVLLMAFALAWLLDTGRAYPYDYIGDAPLAPLSATFDANWFGNIATEGYSRSANVNEQQNYHFFPLYPFTMRIAGALVGFGGVQGGYNVAGVLVSHIFFFAALVALYGLTLRVFDSRTIASSAVWVAAFLPWSFVFSMAYTEALFLLLSVLAVLMAYEARKDMSAAKVAAASLLVTLAALTRPQGLVLVVPVAALLVFDGRERSLLRRLALVAAVSVPPALAVAGFILYVGQQTGNLVALLQVNRAWGQGWLPDMQRLLILPPRNPMWFVDVVATVGLLAWVALLVLQVRTWSRPAPGEPAARRSLLWASLAFSLVYFAFTVFASPSNSSWGRYMIAVYPNILIVAQLAAQVEARRARMLLALSLTLQVLMFAAAVLLQLTP